MNNDLPHSMVRNFDSAPISIKSVANRTFASDSAWKGWTDQGPENDMRIFRKEELRVKQFAFEILPEGGPQCLALSKRFPGFARTAETETSNRIGNYILLLHTGAWLETNSSCGYLTVEYADSTREEFEILKGRDLQDWHQPKTADNYKLAWYGMDGQSYRNLGFSAFPVRPKPIRSLKFTAGPSSIWLVVAAACATGEKNPAETISAPHFLDADPQTFYKTADPLSGIPGAKFLGLLKTKTSSEIRKSIVGVGFETLDRETFDPETVYDVLGESGIKHARVQCGWRKCEKKPGVYNFSWLDGIVDNLLRRGVEVWLQLSFGNPLYTPNSKYDAFKKEHPGEEPVSGFLRGFVADTPFYHGPEAMNSWLRFVSALTEHYRNRIRDYEVWNEPDGNFFWAINSVPPYSGISPEEMQKRTARDFFEFTKQTAEAVRSVRPDARIAICPSKLHGVYIRELGKLGIGKVIDILACHTYDATTQAFDQAHYNQIRAIIRPKEMWMGEGGSLSKGDPTAISLSGLFAATELSQAKHNARRLTTDAGCGMRLSSIYTMSDLKSYWSNGNDSSAGIYCRKERRPKLAYYAMQSVATLFDGMEIAPDLGLYPEIPLNNTSVLAKNALQCFAFRKNGIPLFAIFSPEIILFNPEPIRCAVECSMDGPEIKNPVVIDPLRQKVYSLPALYSEGGLSIPVLDVPNYPVFITDRSAIELQ